jgi:hypothetical protein
MIGGCCIYYTVFRASEDSFLGGGVGFRLQNMIPFVAI